LTVRTLRITATVAAMLLLTAIVAPTGAREAAKTKVTIEGGGGDYFGYVKSAKLKCKSNRKVKLYKQLGSEQRPRTDKFINSDLAQPNNDGYQWNTGSTGVHKGKVYARAGRIPGCKAGSSRTIKAS
jgi:hypothetical protein